MRCYCCNRSSPSMLDTETNRYYCTSCWWVIVDDIEQKEEDNIDADIDSLDLSELQS